MPALTDQELIETLEQQLPALLDRQPELEPALYGAFLKIFVRKEDAAKIMQELHDFRIEASKRFNRVEDRVGKVENQLTEFRQETNQHFEQVDQRFEQVDKRFETLEKKVEDGFRNIQKQFDRFGARWGIRNESLFRETIEALLAESFGVRVEQKHIAGEQFDEVIYDGQHILIEITASTEPRIQERLERKKKTYTEATGIVPTRIILATASIHSKRAQALREAGIDVIEPEEAMED